MPILSATSTDDLNTAAAGAAVDIHPSRSPSYGNSTRDIPAAGLSTGAFTVLSADTVLTLGAGKPNAIVRPTRRRDPNADHRGSEHTQLFDLHDAAADAHRQAAASMADGGGKEASDGAGERFFELGSFTKELDLKLRRLQGYGKKSSSKNVRSGRGGMTNSYGTFTQNETV